MGHGPRPGGRMESGLRHPHLACIILCTILSSLIVAAPAESAPPSPAETTAQVAGSDLLEDPTRLEADRTRDEGSKPLAVFAFFGVRPAMTVVDYFPFGGYNTHLLSKIVGPEGRVLATRPDYFTDELKARIESAALTNVELVAGLDDIADGTVDVVVTVRNLHDLYVFVEGEPAREYAGFLRVLKPDGILGIVDARTPNDGADPDTHRINEQFAAAEVTAAGLVLLERSELLADPDDDHGDSRFPLRHTIDRMLLKFGKPGDAPSQPSGVASDHDGDQGLAQLRARAFAPPRLAAEDSCPVAAEGHQISTEFAAAVGPGPVYPVGLSWPQGATLYPWGSAVVNGDWYSVKTLWVIDPEYNGPVLIRGGQIDGSELLRFSSGPHRMVTEHVMVGNQEYSGHAPPPL